ncbi:MAG: NYN domain-containing protein [Chloroflexota bacterium]
MKNNILFAVLIDGDNAEASLLPEMLEVINQYGQAIISNIYGDWTEPQMKSWKPITNTYSIRPVQQFRYTTGKNATDSTLIIDAMDILHQDQNINGFCIVSSDSDYTRLAQRIRESGLYVLGIGRKNTPKPFVNACNDFIFTESLGIQNTKKVKTSTTSSSNKKNKNIEKLLIRAFNECPKKDGWVYFGVLDNVIAEIAPKFDRKTYGYSQLSDLVQDYQHIIEIRKKGKVYSGRLRQ